MVSVAYQKEAVTLGYKFQGGKTLMEQKQL